MTSAAYSPDGRFVVIGLTDSTARLLDLQNPEHLEIRRFAGHESAIWSVDFAPDGQHILTGSLDNTARIWDVSLDNVKQELCQRLPRDFTDSERIQFRIVGTEPTCDSFAGHSIPQPTITMTPVPTNVTP